MSRAALWRQENNVQERQRQAQDTFLAAVEEGRNNRARNLLPLHGPDDTFNLNPMLLESIVKSQYFTKCCRDIHDWNALVDEVYYQVKHLEPWTVGASKTPSTAFCLLLRLFTLRCTEKQMTLLLQHQDSPYIPCIGFLYLRYTCPPHVLYGWMEPYLYSGDHDEAVLVQVTATAGSRQGSMTIGAFVRSLLTNMDYYGTRLPRLPVQVERDIKVKLLQAEHSENRAKSHLGDERVMEHFRTLGSRVRALYGDDENPVTWYDAVVDRVITKDENDDETVASGRSLLKRPKFVVTFPEYGNTEVVTLGEMDMPDGRSSGNTHNHQGSGRGSGNSSSGRSDVGVARRGNDARRPRDDRNGGDNYRRHTGGDRGYANRPPVDRHHGGRHHDDDRWERHGNNRHGWDGRHERDSRNSVPSEKDLLEQVLRQEREQSTSSRSSNRGHHDSRSRASTKRSPPRDYGDGDRGLASGNKRPASTESHATAPSATTSSSESAAPPRAKSAQELAAIAEKKRKLVAKYG